jgi:predicted alpha/beta superfamily hydrolase
LLKEAPELFSKQKTPREFVNVAIGADEHIITQRNAEKSAKLNKTPDKVIKRLAFKKFKNEDHATVLHNAIYQGLFDLHPTKQNK